LTVTPGEGVFVSNPGSTDLTVTFVGEVAQGTASNVTIPAGFSIRSSAVPQAGTATDLQFPAANNDRIYKWNNTTGTYDIFNFSTVLGWTPTVPNIDVGQAFFVRMGAQTAWNRNFSVNG